jgi:hypothetical protein
MNLSTTHFVFGVAIALVFAGLGILACMVVAWVMTKLVYKPVHDFIHCHTNLSYDNRFLVSGALTVAVTGLSVALVMVVVWPNLWVFLRSYLGL